MLGNVRLYKVRFPFFEKVVDTKHFYFLSTLIAQDQEERKANLETQKLMLDFIIKKMSSLPVLV